MEKYIADLVIAAVLLIAAVLGAYKGLLKSLAGVVILAVAFVGAAFVADALADPVAQWMGPLVEQRIEESLANVDTTDVEAMLSSLRFGGGELEQMVNEVLQTVQETGATLISAVTEKVTRSIAYAAVYLVAFLALLLAGWLLLQPLNAAMKLPGLKTLNAVGGGALGLLWGVLLVFAAVWLLLRFGWLLTAEMVENSLLLRFFANNSPLSLLALIL